MCTRISIITNFKKVLWFRPMWYQYNPIAFKDEVSYTYEKWSFLPSFLTNYSNTDTGASQSSKCFNQLLHIGLRLNLTVFFLNCGWSASSWPDDTASKKDLLSCHGVLLWHTLDVSSQLRKLRGTQSETVRKARVNILPQRSEIFPDSFLRPKNSWNTRIESCQLAYPFLFTQPLWQGLCQADSALFLDMGCLIQLCRNYQEPCRIRW